MGWLTPVPAAEVEARLTAKGRATPLRRCLGLCDLVLLGLGKMVGAGIFVLLGAAAETAGNAVVLAYLAAGLAALMSALVYGELSARVPACGSAYAYVLLGLGRLPAVATAQLVLLEYTVGAAALGAGWAAYCQNFLAALGVQVQTSWGPVHPLAAGAVLAVGGIALTGIRQAATFASVVAALKLALVLVVVICALWHVEPSSWTDHTFAPHGVEGILQAASKVFYSFIGFEALTTTAEEAVDPRRSVPRAILLCVAAATLIYVGVCVSVTMMVPYESLEVGAPVATAFERRGQHGVALLVSGVCTVGLLAGLLLNLVAGARLWFTLAGEGFVPSRLAGVNEASRVPVAATCLGTLLSTLLALLAPLEVLVTLMATGTITAFVVVSVSLGALKGRPGPYLAYAGLCLTAGALGGWARVGAIAAAAVAAGFALWPGGPEEQPLVASHEGFAAPAAVPLLAIAANAALLSHVEPAVLLGVGGWVACGLLRAGHLALSGK